VSFRQILEFRQCPLDQRDCRFGLSTLICDDPEKMQRFRVIRVLLQRLTVKLLGALEPSCPVVGETGIDRPRDASRPASTLLRIGCPPMTDGWQTRHRCDPALLQHLQERAQMLLVTPPAPDRTSVQGLAHLPRTRRQNRPIRLIELKTTRFPVEPEEFDQPAALAFEVSDQVLVVDGQHAQRQRPAPMLRQPLDLEPPKTALGQVVSPRNGLIKPTKIA